MCDGLAVLLGDQGALVEERNSMRSRISGLERCWTRSWGMAESPRFWSSIWSLGILMSLGLGGHEGEGLAVVALGDAGDDLAVGGGDDEGFEALGDGLVGEDDGFEDGLPVLFWRGCR